MINNPAIVVVAFNRPVHLRRLLTYLDKAEYPKTLQVSLVISIDYQDSKLNKEVREIADKFKWGRGNKTVIIHDKNLGLRRHILKCGDLTEDYGSIILLEDDLIVAPAFYQFAKMSSEFYLDTKEVAGISLYSYEYEELGLNKFYPKYNGKSTFFMQWASSWGQLWTKKQWSEFKTWYSENENLEDFNISDRVKNWKNSWKKYYIAYLVDTNKYFVYPYFSFTTLIDDIGTNIKSEARVNYVKLNMAKCLGEQDFTIFSENSVKYDSFFQPLDTRIYVSELKQMILVSFDFFGTKSLKNIASDYVVSIKASASPIKKFANALIPYELNILYNEEGNIFSLSQKKDLLTKNGFLRQGFIMYNLRRKNSIKNLLNIILYKIVDKIIGLKY